MNARRAVNKDLCVWALEGFHGEIDAAFKQLGRLKLEIVVGGIPENINVVGDAEVAIVEFNLHVDDVSHAFIRDFDHLDFVPDTSSNRNAVGDPGHIHTYKRLQHPLFRPGKEIIVLRTYCSESTRVLRPLRASLNGCQYIVRSINDLPHVQVLRIHKMLVDTALQKCDARIEESASIYQHDCGFR
jgi:hypothetical protein